MFCVDCDDFVQEIISYRGLNPNSSDCHCGLDGGQGILKVGITITDRDEVGKESVGRSTYADVSKNKTPITQKNLFKVTIYIVLQLLKFYRVG